MATASDRVGRIGFAGALAALALGALALVGWQTSWLGLARGSSAGIPMAVSTAGLFVVLGGTLAALARGHARSLLPAVGAAAVAVAAMNLAAYARGEVAALDRWLVPAAATAIEGRMSPLTGFAFLFAGLAAFALALEPRWPRAGDVAGALGSLVGALGLLVLLAELYGAAPIGRGEMVPVARTTALALVGLGTALVAACAPVRFPLRHFSGPSHGARLARSFLPLVPLVLIAQAAFYVLAPVFADDLRDAVLSLVLLAAVLSGVLGAARGAGRTLDRAEALRRESQERLLQAQRLEAMGRLAGGVAHDFNNLLGVILGHAERLEQDASAEVARRAAEITRAGQRAAGLTHQLLAFGRKQVIEPVALDFGALVAGCEELARSLIGDGVGLELSIAPEPAPVLADPGQLRQVVVNLCAHARDATPRGGLVRVEVNAVTLEADQHDRGWTLPAGQYQRLAVTDSGPGLDGETLAHVFEPFFPTREDGPGAGLGLPTVYGIVKQSGGFIRVHSAAGRGTCFEVLMPRHEGAPAPVAGTGAQAAAPSRATILLVEDEAPLRELLVEVLSDAGHEVIAAGSALQALERAVAHGGRIDLLVTDVVMPGADGRQLARELLSQRPGVRVLFISGYSEDILSSGGRIEPGLTLLAKPFAAHELLARVRELLAGAAAPPPA